MKTRLIGPFCALLFLTFGLVNWAYAGPLFSARAEGGSGEIALIQDLNLNLPTPQTASVGPASSANSTVQATASADPGILSGSTRIDVSQDLGLLSGSGRMFSEFVLDDVVFTSNDTAAFVDTSMNLDIAGLLQAVSPTDINNFSLLRVRARIGGTDHVGNTQINTVNGVSSLSQFGFLDGAGALSGNTWSINDIVTTPEFMGVRVGIPQTLSVILELQSNAGVRATMSTGPSAAFARSDFLSTVSFSTLGSVFELPSGFTVNSDQGNIVDNRFGVSASVPEPATLALMGLGLAGLGFARRRRLHA